jgi:hypothetical protein
MTGMKTLIGGLVVGESPRWHDGRLWFCNWGTQEMGGQVGRAMSLVDTTNVGQ